MEQSDNISPLIMVKCTLKYVFGSMKKESPVLFFIYLMDILLKIGQVLINIVFPKYFIDELAGDQNKEILLILVLVIVAGNGIITFLASMLSSIKEKYKDYFNRKLDVLLSEKVMEMDYQYTEEPWALEKIQLSKNGIKYSQGIVGIMESLESGVISIILLFTCVGIIVTGTPVIMAVIAVLVIFHFIFGKKLSEIEIGYFEKNAEFDRCFDYVHWKLSDIRYGKDIRLYNSSELMLDKVNYYNGKLTEQMKDQAQESRKVQVADSLVILIQNSFVFAYLGIQICRKKLSLGSFSMYIGAANSFSEQVNNLIRSFLELCKKSYFMNEYIMFVNSDIEKKSGDRIPEIKEDSVIEFRNVSYQYPNTDHFVLKDFSMKLSHGQKLAIVGMNGAGKSTLVKLLMRLYEPSEGEILLNHVNIREYNYKSYLQLFGTVFQDFKILSCSISENISLSEANQSDRKRIEDVVALTGLEEKVKSLKQGLDTSVFKFFDDNGIEPSGGEQQKIAMARVVYHDAPIMILDEPTASLDPIAEENVFSQFNSITSGKTAIYISHRLSSCKFCDQIAVIEDGKLSDMGTHDELVKHQGGLYQRMFLKQSQYYQ